MRPIRFVVLFGGIASSAGAATASGTVAERVILKDGTEVLGQRWGVEGTRLLFVVRRAWAEANVPERFERWKEAEAERLRLAVEERRARLERWRDERQAANRPRTEVDEWLDREIARLDGGPEALESTPLMIVILERREIARLDERSEADRLRLRQAWSAGFDDPETMPAERLTAALEDRGFAGLETDAAPIAALLPIPRETDRQWLARRASTELLHLPGSRWIRYGTLVLPEPEPGRPVDLGGLERAIAPMLEELIEGRPQRDPLQAVFDQAEAEGRVGVQLTTLDMAPDFRQVAVEAALWVRLEPGRWTPAARRRVQVGTAEPDPDAQRRIAEDPAVQRTFQLFEALGLGSVGEEARRRSLRVGSAVQRALSRAKVALNADLQSVALDLTPR